MDLHPLMQFDDYYLTIHDLLIVVYVNPLFLRLLFPINLFSCLSPGNTNSPLTFENKDIFLGYTVINIFFDLSQFFFL